MKSFEEYFSFEAIVGDLIRWRVKGKGTFDENGRRDVNKVLPPRKAWSRAGAKAREGIDPEAVRKQAVWRTVRRECGRQGEKRSAMRWAQNLMRLVDEVRRAVFSGKVAFEKPRMMKIPKGYKDGVREFRDVASFDRLADRVVLSRTTAYVRDVLEGVLGDCCYSFRRDSEWSHQLAIEKLQEWRTKHAKGEMFVAECDIKKFFDNISHDVVRRCWEKAGFDAAAGKVLEAYLAAYSSPDAERCGLPQGGSFSTVLANLVLHEADETVEASGDGRLFYARFCDDVVIAHPEAAVCRAVLKAYMAALARLKLPVHPVVSFVYRPADGQATDYYAIKSKGPFRWGEPAVGEADCAPWVSFLGCQVRYDGETRIREESIDKHIRSLGHETAAKVREVAAGALDGKPQNEVAKWFLGFRNRLIAKGVGYVTAKVKDCQLCWAGAFPNVTACADTKMQMRRLDRVRNGMLTRLAGAIRARGKATGGFALVRHRYKGRPFSYFGFLEKATRPTNMARRSVRVLPYSEL